MLSKFRNSYHNASQWAHHHTIVVCTGLILCATVFGWQFANLFISQDSVSANYSTLDCSTASNINVPISECQALLDLYDSTNGPSWYTSNGWDTDTDVCTWDGIGCTQIEGQNRVTYLGLGSNNLVGTLPASLGDLSEMVTVYIADNQLNTQLPIERSSWTNIQSFRAEQNQIYGSLPSERSSRANIQEFSIQGNQLASELPSERSSWTNIQSFRAERNQIYGSLPSERSSWTNIQDFYIDNNQLTSILPTERSLRTNIERFYVGNNYITGELPSQRSSWTNIQYFSVFDNQNMINMSGVLPTERSSWINIQYFDVYNAGVSGIAPTERSSWTNIQDFDISANQITGVLPTERSTWTNIQDFDISDNQITGVLPSERSTWTNIRRFDVSNNQITGELPSEWSSWINVDRFFASDNQLNGALPTERSAWNSITDLRLSSNNLDGNLPTERSSRTNIYSVIISENQFTGELPPERSTWTNMQTFIASDNQLTGPLPTERSAWTNMIDLRAEDNQLNGSLPSERSTWTNMQILYIGGNDLIGVLPTERSTWTNMIDLRAEDNQLTGELPTQRSTRTNISNFEVYDNQIGGQLPTERSSWINIDSFRVEYNQIDGFMPENWAVSWPDRGWEYVNLTNNCLETVGYSSGTQAWMDINVNLEPQNNCTIADISVSKTTTQTDVTDGDIIVYTIDYSHNSGDTGQNVTIYDYPGTGLSIIDASLSYVVGQTEVVYGVTGDLCFDNLASNTTGPYADVFNQYAAAFAGSGVDFYTLLSDPELGLGYTGDENRGQRWIDYIEEDSESDFGLYIEAILFQMGLELSVFDPSASCGLGGDHVYIFTIGTLSEGESGTITVTGQVATSGFDDGQDVLVNSVEIVSNIGTDTDIENNTDSVAVALTITSSASDPTPTQNNTTITGSSTTIVGTGTPGHKVTIIVPGQGEYTGTVGGNSYFEVLVNLNNGENNLVIIIEDPESEEFTEQSLRITVEPESNSGPQPASNPGGGYLPSLQTDEQVGICEQRSDCSDSYYDRVCGPCKGQTHNSADEKSVLIDSSIEFIKQVGEVMQGMSCDISQELVQAYVFASDIGITTVPHICDADMMGPLRRKHLAKFLSIFAVQILDKDIVLQDACTFSDTQSESQEFQLFTTLSCKLGLMGLRRDGTPDTKFNPNGIVTRGEFGAAFNRLLNGDRDNTAINDPRPWYEKHLQSLQNAGIMTQIDTPNTEEIRGYVMLMMMRAYQKLQQ